MYTKHVSLSLFRLQRVHRPREYCVYVCVVYKEARETETITQEIEWGDRESNRLVSCTIYSDRSRDQTR